MAKPPEIDLPTGINWRYWVQCWDQMQQQYVPSRDDWFAIIIRTIKAVRSRPRKVLDLGCGTGTLMLHLLENFPQAQVFGIDFDPTLLPLARERLSHLADRTHLIYTDLRDSSWTGFVPDSMDAVVSTTALHWLKPDELACLYTQIAKKLRPGGIFLNADHVGSNSSVIQKVWQWRREKALAGTGTHTWEAFWQEYTRALYINAARVNHRVIGGWQGGIEEGMPLAWHFEKLRENGFSCVDCFWRCDGDAIYGGILQQDKAR